MDSIVNETFSVTIDRFHMSRPPLSSLFSPRIRYAKKETCTPMDTEMNTLITGYGMNERVVNEYNSHVIFSPKKALNK